MATTIQIGEEVTVGTTAVEYVIDETTATITKPTADKTRLIVGVQNGYKNLWAKGSAAGQKFIVA